MASRLKSARRGVILIGFVVALMVVSTLVLWALQLTAVGATSALAHFNSTGAFYSAESGVEMALREISQSNDIDSDGTKGTISNNNNPADDPSLATGSFSVGVSGTTYTATGSWRGYTRVVKALTQ